MPREFTILTDSEPNVEALVHAGAAIDPDLRLRVIDDGAVTELCTDDGLAVLSVGRPEWMRNAAELERLVPEAVGRVAVPLWWLDAWAPWGVEGEVGARIAHAFAAAIGGFAMNGEPT